MKTLPIPADPAAGPAADERVDLREALLVLRRHRWLILFCAAALAGLTAWRELRRPDRYQSSATLRVTDARHSLTGALDDDPTMRQFGAKDPVLSQMEVLHSRTLLGAVVDQQALRARLEGMPRTAFTRLEVLPSAPAETLEVAFSARGVALSRGGRRASAPYGQPVSLDGVTLAAGARPSVAGGQLVVEYRDRAVDRLVAGLSARPRESTDLFDLSFTSGSPEHAQRVLESLIVRFQEHNADQAQQESRRRRIFIENQLRETDSILSVAQAGLSDFRRRQRVYSTRDQFSAEQTGLMDLDVRREELQAERQAAAALLGAAE
ncbi:MAG TPA: Wzz/FepE/Etk N-terminal domain-containing protein, partial [Longimicrobiaceae bacterium]|nr:Wzz/FepE/Etk N-terminal domain-containing protein [Longimicrobiaceae bacterium]